MFTSLLAAWFLYPRVIAALYWQDVPDSWGSVTTTITMSELEVQLGAPTEDATGKDYQNWVVREWWGMQILKVVYRDCCSPSTHATDIYRILKVTGYPRYQRVEEISPP